MQNFQVVTKTLFLLNLSYQILGLIRSFEKVLACDGGSYTAITLGKVFGSIHKLNEGLLAEVDDSFQEIDNMLPLVKKAFLSGELDKLRRYTASQ